jgi:predicted neuraminidase
VTHQSIQQAQLIYPLDRRPTPQCHASTIAETSRGLVAAWFGGEREGHAGVGIWLARILDGQWSEPVQVARGLSGPKQYPCWNPVLFQPANGPLMLFYLVGPSPRAWWSMLITSRDCGESWSEPRRLPKGIYGPIKNKPIQLPDDSLLCPTSEEEKGWQVFMSMTSDLGDSWEKVGPLNDLNVFAAIQPTLLTYPGGIIQALCRSRQGVITEIRSSDNGKTWSQMLKTDLPNPNSGIDGVTLASGQQLLVYNHTVTGRSPLSVAVSNDGKQWRHVVTLEQTRGEFSYPAVIQSADGGVNITYTYRRQSVKHVVLQFENVVC